MRTKTTATSSFLEEKTQIEEEGGEKASKSQGGRKTGVLTFAKHAKIFRRRRGAIPPNTEVEKKSKSLREDETNQSSLDFHGEWWKGKTQQGGRKEKRINQTTLELAKGGNVECEPHFLHGGS